jgi:very-short-patch-repair endonuclease
MLWAGLKGRQISGCKFRRQYGVGPYVIDCYCPAQKLAVEIDGESHVMGDVPEYDRERQTYIEQFGIRFLRFNNMDIYENMNGALEAIEQAITSVTSPLSPP